MKLAAGWDEVLRETAQASLEPITVRPLDPVRAPAQIRVATAAADAWDLIQGLQATSLAAIAITHVAPAQAGRFAAPSAVGLAAWGTDGAVFASVFNVRAQGVLEALGTLLRLPVTWVGHDLKLTLFGLWAAGLDPQVYALHDTRVAAMALHLGEGHARARVEEEGISESIRQRIEGEAERERFFSLEGQCDHHQIALPMAPPASASIDGVDVRALASRAIWTLHLYLAQQPQIVTRSLQGHLNTIEFPFVVANARVEYRGVAADPARIDKLREACTRAAAEQAATLRSYGVDPPGSTDALMRVLTGLGLEVTSLDDTELRRTHHPVAGAFSRYRRFRQLAREPWQSDVDGRVHPEHRQLGAATGRNGCRRPNLTNLSRMLRPVIVAPPGRALIEFDYCQIEAGVAAAEHDDAALIDAFNRGDVYAAAAQGFYELTEAERALSPMDFARERPDLRVSMKPFVLAVLYGGGPRMIAEKHGIPVQAAQEQIDRFLALYPKLAAGLEASSVLGEARGYALITTGLTRTFDRSASRSWVRNLLRNTPIQGGAAVVLKEAVIRLDEEFRGTSAWIVAMIHDAVLVECDAADVAWVRQRVPQVMVAAVRRFYPQLQPRIDVNDSDTTCWNKKGHADSLDQFLADPQYSIESARPVARELELDMDDPGPELDAALDSDLRRLMAERGMLVDLAEWHDRFDERAALREFDGGQYRETAEAGARAEVIAAFVEFLGAPASIELKEDPFVAAVLEVFGGVVEPVTPFQAEAVLDAMALNESELVGVGGGAA